MLHDKIGTWIYVIKSPVLAPTITYLNYAAVSVPPSNFYDVVTVVDVNLPNVSGLEACRRVLQMNPRAKVIVITAMLVT